MQKITPHLWFDKEAKEAAGFYASVFAPFDSAQGISKVTNVTTIHDTPSGDCDIVSFMLAGQNFMAISAGPLFKFTPAISFLVACTSKEEVDALWAKLSAGGEALMPLGTYPFSERYGWTKDKYGLSWQVMHMGTRPITQKITPTFMFVGDVCGKAEEAISLYTSVFPFDVAQGKSSIGNIMRYGAGAAPDKEGTITHAGFTLFGEAFAAMDSAHEHKFTFTEAISLMVHCDTQEEIDAYWEKLSAVPAAEQCGWLKDKFGVSWQIVPTAMSAMMASGDKEKIARITQAFLKMKKFDIAALEKAYNG